MNKRLKMILFAAAAFTFVSTQAFALAIGDQAPKFDLAGIDGKNHSFDEYADKKARIVVFTCNHCPYAKAYEDRINAIQNDFGPRGAQVIAINPNVETVPADSFEEMKTRAAEKNFAFPYLADPTQEVAKAYGAVRTPHIFVFDQAGKLSYTGTIDDNWEDASAVKEKSLANAVEAIVSGQAPAKPETYAIGCTIKWKK